MSTRIIQAEARISAVDATGQTFAAIATKVRGVTSAFKSLGNVGASGIGSMSRNIGRLQHTMRAIAPVASSAAAYEGMRGVSGLIHETMKATAERAHEQVRMDVAGMSESEIAAAERVSGELSQRYKALSQTTIMHALRNMRAIVGTYEEAGKILEPVLKLRIAAMGAHPERAAEMEEDFDKLVKGMEIKGVTMDPEKFASYINGMAKAINVFGDTLRPTDYYEMFKYGRQSTQNLSEKFMLETAPTLAQELGGMSAGRAMSSFYQAIVGGRIKQQSVKELAALGLINEDRVVRTKTGSIKGLLPGGVKGWQEAASNPYGWVNDVLLPALQAHGIKDKDQIQAVIGTIFQQATAAQMAGIFATQQARIEKDWNLVHGAKGTEAADLFQSKDPFVAWSAVTEQFKNFLAVAGSPLAQPAAKGLNELASGIAALENLAKGHPLAATGGTAFALAGGGLATWKLSSMALRRFFGMVRGGAGAATAAEDLTAEAAIRAMQAAQLAPLATGMPGWMRALGPLSLPFLAAPPAIWAAGKAQQYFGDVDVGQRSGNAVPGVGWFPNVAPVDKSPEVKGSADLNVSVQVEPSDSFLARIEAIVRNAISGLSVNGAEPGSGVGTAGSTGLSMPPASPAP
jgi:hypothetical protein